MKCRTQWGNERLGFNISKNSVAGGGLWWVREQPSGYKESPVFFEPGLKNVTTQSVTRAQFLIIINQRGHVSQIQARVWFPYRNVNFSGHFLRRNRLFVTYNFKHEINFLNPML